MASPESLLEALLRDLFNEAELRAFVRGRTGGAALAGELPGTGVPFGTLAHEAALLLQRRGRLDDELFAALAPHAGSRFEQVVEAARAAGCAPPEPPPKPRMVARRGPAKAPPASDTPLRVFVSYTARDLVEHAKAAVAAVRRLEWVALDHRD